MTVSAPSRTVPTRKIAFPTAVTVSGVRATGLMTVAADTERPVRMTVVMGTVIRKDGFPVRRVAISPVSPDRVRALSIGVAIPTTPLS